MSSTQPLAGALADMSVLGPDHDTNTPMSFRDWLVVAGFAPTPICVIGTVDDGQRRAEVYMAWPARLGRGARTRPPTHASGPEARQRWIAVDEATQLVRQRQSTAALNARYALQAALQGALCHGVRAVDLREARYIGSAKTPGQHGLTAAALTLARLLDGILPPPRPSTRTSRCAAIASRALRQHSQTVTRTRQHHNVATVFVRRGIAHFGVETSSEGHDSGTLASQAGSRARPSPAARVAQLSETGAQ